ncbi:MAG: lamin tail domain-containing protein [Verrucomicrobia bacterium]|nr:lamin tail domain-containing protein [Verrucomicrobiota bacterium]
MVVAITGGLGVARVQAASSNPQYGLQFDGIDDYVTFGLAPELGVSTFTLETWFAWTGSGSAASSGAGGVTAIPLLTKGRGEYDGDARDMNFFLGIRGSDRVLVADFEEAASSPSPGQNDPVIGVTPVGLDEWHHAAATFDGTEWRLYLDGQLEATRVVGRLPRADSIQHAALATTLDSSGVTPSGFFAGVLDEARIWNVARTGAQIAESMTLPLAAAPGLIGRWGMDEGAGTVLNNSVGDGPAGALVGGPAWGPGYAFATAPTVALTQPAAPATFIAPVDVTIAATASDPDGAVSNVAFFAGSQRIGTATAAPYAVLWHTPPPGQYVLTAVATDNSGLSSTSAPVAVTVENPVVQMTAPAHGARFPTGLAIGLAAAAQASNDVVTGVTFFAGTGLIGDAASPPYEVAWNPASPGDYALTAVAAVSGGLRHTSAPVRVTVFDNRAPGVALTSPAMHATFFAPADLVLAAAASDSDGVVTNVQFWAGATLLGDDATAPFAWVWAGVSAGDYDLAAVARDEWGMAATSAVVRVQVQVSAPPGIVSFTPPAGVVSNLSQVHVVFSEPVDGVHASDLLVNGAAASSVSGSDAQYVFTFPMPPEGPVSVAWAVPHGIVDRETPPKAFSGAGPGETAAYEHIDARAPVVAQVFPSPGTRLRTLTQIRVTFSEAVRGVQAADLSINGIPAAGVSGADKGPYVFSFGEPPLGTVRVAWADGHGITDFARQPNAFEGGGWTYARDPNASYEGAVVINEIMYHPASTNADQEYVELHNTTAEAVPMAGWRFHRGVDFAFGNLTLPPGGYLVVAAHTQAFAAKYPDVTNVVGNWTGRLSNDDETLELEDALGERVDRVPYADEGDWAIRQRGPNSADYYGWEWYAEHDGSAYNTANGQTVSDRSLELVNPALPNEHGPNWAASTVARGTPGAPNTRASTNIAPLVLDVAHFPVIPKPTDPVTVTARIVDEHAPEVSAALLWRNHSTLSPPAFTRTPMRDDGLNGDGVAGDGVYGVTLPAQANGTVIEFYVEAADERAQTRTWPAAARQRDNTFAQTANALWQVDEHLAGMDESGQPVLRLIMTESERYELEHINRASDAEMNATFICTDGTGIQCRYLAGVRIRGGGSRSRTPPNYRVNLPCDRRWQGLAAINLNTQFIHAQIAASAFALKSGLPAAAARPVQVRVNGANLVRSATPTIGTSDGSGFGAYVLLEPLNGDWAERHFPNDGDGNVYRNNATSSANLAYNGTNASAYSGIYTKASNQSANDYGDLIRLTHALSSGLPDPVYSHAVQTNANVPMWMRYFAVCSLLVYSENGLPTGVAQDYAMYRGMVDPRFLLVPHDCDTILGEGDGSATTWGTGVSIWLMVDRGGLPTLTRFMRHNEFAPLYFRELKRLADTTFSDAEVQRALEELFGGWVPAHVIARMRTYAAQRVASVLSQIPQTYAATTALPTSGGYYHATATTAPLSGTANALETRAVRINGAEAAWTAWQGTWSGTASLMPGLNHVLIQFLGDGDREVARTNLTVWRDTGSSVTLSGNIEDNRTLRAEDGPYLVTGDLYVETHVTLTVAPGATLYLADGVTVHGQGRLVAEGSPEQRIRISRPPGSTGTWRSLRFSNPAVEHRLRHVDIEHGGKEGAPNLYAHGARLHVEDVTWANTTSTLLDLYDSSITLVACTLPGLAGTELLRFNGMPADGAALIQSNWFGSTTLGADVARFTGATRPWPIPQILDNVFTGSSDDVLEFMGADAHIENNLFVHVHQDAPRADAAHAIAAGRTNDIAPTVIAVRNLFADCDHALLLQDGAAATFHHNTVVAIRTHPPASEPASAISLGDAHSALPPGAQADLVANIFWNLDGDRLVSNLPSNALFQVRQCIVPGTNWPGEGNLTLDPQFVNLAGAGDPRTLRQDLRLRPGSPALGAGPNGLDLGALVQAWVTLAGVPSSPTALTTATVTAWGAGVAAFAWQITPDWGDIYVIEQPVVLTHLTNGSYRVLARGINSAGVWQDYENATLSRRWTVNTNLPGLRLNEILARNDTAVPVSDRYPDLIELHNCSVHPVSLAGMTLTDNRDLPAKFTFPAGATLGPDHYLVLYADAAASPPGYHLGFTLQQSGDDVSLFDAQGQLLDAVAFGPQVRDASIGRLADGTWALTVPTFGAANRAARTGDPATLKLNEWLAASGSTGDDFIELYNPDPLPVALGGFHLSDLPYHWPDRHAMAPLSYVAGDGFVVLIADGQTDRGPDHLSFNLPAEQGQIALFAADLTPIDAVMYGSQTNHVAMGRSPNGSPTLAGLPMPTPGSPNPAPAGMTGSQVVLNEVFAKNLEVTQIGMPNPAGKTPEWIELFNATTGAVDLADLSLTDDVALPRKYVFAPGTFLAVGGHWVVLCEGDQPASATNTGFGIKANGDTIYLYDRLDQGGSLIDSIQYGVQARDFSIGRTPDGGALWRLTLPTAGSANLAAQLGNPSVLRINEWMADPVAGDDWFELHNPGAQPVALDGLCLTDDLSTPASRTKSPIPALSFIGTGLYGFEQFIADGNADAGPDHVRFKLSGNGEAIGLFQTADAAIDVVTFGLQTEGVSEGRLPDGSPAIARFPATPTPNQANYLPLDTVVINEVLTHTDPPLEDAIELHNASGAPVNLGGWYLSDSARDLFKYRIPQGTILDAGGHIVFYEAQFNLDVDLTSPFGLDSAKGETLYLSEATTNSALTGYRATARFGAAEWGVSFGRFTNQVGEVHFVALSDQTFGIDEPETVEAFRFGTGKPNAPPRIGPVVFTEIMYHPPGTNDTDNLRDEFVELRNLTAEPVPLFDPLHPANTWRLRGGIDFDLPPGTTLPAGDCLLVVPFDPVADPPALAAFRAAYALHTNVHLLGPYAGKLDNGGESIALYKPDAPEPAGDPDEGQVPYVLVEEVGYDDAPPWPVSPNPDGGGASLQRLEDTQFANDPLNWTAASPTPGPQGLLIDFDNDGMPDLWEVEHGLNPNANDAHTDLDADGASNLQEWRAGTRPDSASSTLQLSVTVATQVALTFDAQPDRAYVVESAERLPDGPWTPLASLPAQPVARTETVIDPPPPAPRFYRLRLAAWPGSAP